MQLTTNRWLFAVVIFAILAVQGGGGGAAAAAAAAAESEEFDAADDAADDYPEELEEHPVNVIQPNFTSTSEEFRCKAGDTVRLPCEVDQMDTNLVYFWRYNSNMLFINTQRTETTDERMSLDGYSLVIRNISRELQGQYTCQISSGANMVLAHNVTVLESPTASPLPASGVIVVRKGQPLTLSCHVSGNPAPLVTWTREGGKKFHGSGHKTMMGTSLTFLDTTSHHAGVYECLAENSQGHPAKARLLATILHEPEVTVEETIMSTQTGYDVELACTVHAEPKAHVTWLFNQDTPIEMTGRYKLTNSGSRHVLNIDHVSVSDFGDYTCVGSNKLGKGQRTIQLTAVPRVSMLLRNKSLKNGVELEWSTFSQIPVTDYRLRYRNATPDAAAQPDDAMDATAHHQWMELNLKAKNVTDLPFTYNHVHQVHGLDQHHSYQLTIESLNHYGWSQPLVLDFTTLSQHAETEASIESSAAPATWCSLATTLVLAMAARLL